MAHQELTKGPEWLGSLIAPLPRPVPYFLSPIPVISKQQSEDLMSRVTHGDSHSGGTPIYPSALGPLAATLP